MRGYSIDQAREAQADSRAWKEEKLLADARKRYPGHSDGYALECLECYYGDLAQDYAADSEWISCHEARRKSELCREMYEALEGRPTPLTFHRHGQLLSLLRELYTRLWHTPPAGPRTRVLRARLLRVIDNVNERLREVAS